MRNNPSTNKKVVPASASQNSRSLFDGEEEEEEKK